MLPSNQLRVVWAGIHQNKLFQDGVALKHEKFPFFNWNLNSRLLYYKCKDKLSLFHLTIFTSSYKIAHEEHPDIVLYFPILLSAHGRSRSAIDCDSVIQRQLKPTRFSSFSRVALTLSPAVLIFLLHQRHRFRTQWMRLQDGRVKREVFIYPRVKNVGPWVLTRSWFSSFFPFRDDKLYKMDDYNGWN